MVNEERLRMIAQRVKRELAAAVREAEEKRQLEVRAAERALEEQRLRDWPSYIEDKVEEAAASGEFSYEFECGDCGERVLKELQVYFASLNPSVVPVKRTRIVNYDLGVDEEYYTTVIIFRW